MSITINLARVDGPTYGDDHLKHQFEQYKLYVEMADRISSRRMLANTFFLTVHTALITAFTVLIKEKILQASFYDMAPFAAVILLCAVWWLIIYSYKQLNSGKFKVIHEMEKHLPIAPYDAEWDALGRGEDKKLYRPITHIEIWVPIIFAFMYIALAVISFKNLAICS